MDFERMEEEEAAVKITKFIKSVAQTKKLMQNSNLGVKAAHTLSLVLGTRRSSVYRKGTPVEVFLLFLLLTSPLGKTTRR
jgi:hypothetical protein